MIRKRDILAKLMKTINQSHPLFEVVDVLYNEQVDSNKTEKTEEVSYIQTNTTFDNFNKLNTEFDTLD